jgi:hypothetical protein
MPDNTVLNAGAGGDTIATDEVGGAKYQRTKRSLGRDGIAVDVATAARVLSAAAANQDSTVIKNGAGTLYGLLATNANAAARYLKVYNKATGPTSADTPVMTIYLPPLGGVALPIDVGADFSAGISLRLTTGVADNDAAAVAANEIIVTAFYA